jgi:DNA-binding transcriptional ArsR family regulator
VQREDAIWLVLGNLDARGKLLAARRAMYLAYPRPDPERTVAFQGGGSRASLPRCELARVRDVREDLADFNQVKKTLGTTDSNLGQHLHVLEQAGLIATTKTGAGQRARTWVRITGKGRTALDREIQALKEIVAIVEAPADQPTPQKQPTRRPQTT